MNSSADLTVLAAATAAEHRPITRPTPPPAPASRALELWLAIRPHQAAKNLLLFVALVFAHQLGDPHRLWGTFLGFLAFSLCASSAYLLNDLVDLEADRAHPVKRNRPLASGRLSPTLASAVSAALAVAALLAALSVSLHFLGAVLVYLAATLAYSFRLKRLLLVDVLVLAGLYAWRVMAGAVASDVALSPWMIQFSIFIFLSIALAKRCAELRRLKLAGLLSTPNTRAYATGDYDQLSLFGTAAGYLAVLVLALYLNSPDVRALYARPWWLWCVCPLLIYWVSRLWILVSRGQMNEDPVLFALHDRASYAVGALVALILLAAL